jgi:hypothetical protein
MLATLLVFVVTMAVVLVQMHFRHTAALAATVLDGAAAAYGAFFVSGTVLPLLAAAAPSRGGTVLVVAGAVPVVASLLPAVRFFAGRLRSEWHIQRRVSRAEEKLRRYGARRSRLSWDRDVLPDCEKAMRGIEVVLKHAGDSWDDQLAARAGATSLLEAAMSTETAVGRRWVATTMEGLTRLGVRVHPVPSVRRNVAHVLVTTAQAAPRRHGEMVVTAALEGLRGLGEGGSVAADERAAMVRATASVVEFWNAAVAPRVPAHDTDRWVSVGEKAGHRSSRLLADRDVSSTEVLRLGTEVIRDLVGVPARASEDSRAARVEAAAFADGCRELGCIAGALLRSHVWGTYDEIIACLEGWLDHRLGVGTGRVDDLVPGHPQNFPYAVELEAASTALVDIAVTAHEKALDHVTRAALRALVRHTRKAVREDQVAFALAARALKDAQRQIAGDGDDRLRDTAARARAVELFSSLQKENTELLLTLGELPRGTGHTAAVHAALRWALRPMTRPANGHGRLALDIARTAQSVRYPGRPVPPWYRSRRRTADATPPEELSDEAQLVMLEEEMAFSHGRVYDLDEDPRVALIEALWSSDGEDPGAAVFRAGAQWRAALEAAGAGAKGSDHGGGHLWRLAGRPYADASCSVSPEAVVFVARVAAWAEEPWCPVDAEGSREVGSHVSALFFVPRSARVAGADLRALLLEHRAERRERIAVSPFSGASDAALQVAGVLWGSWPPPPGCLTDPWDDPEWSDDEAVRDALERHRTDRSGSSWGSWKPTQSREDRLYQARVTGHERVVVTEPDGSTRLLRGCEIGDRPISVRYGVRGELVEALAEDALERLGRCPACQGGSAPDLMPGWCPTCRGSGRHPDFARAARAVRHAVAAVAGDSVEWDISRSALLDAVLRA